MKRKDLDYYMSLNYPVTLEQYEDDGEIRFGLEIPDLLGVWADGKTFDEAYEKLNDAKRVWFETCLEDGIEIPEPVSEEEFSGKFLLRIDPKTHMQITKEAKRMGLSLNQYIKNVLDDKLHNTALDKELKGLRSAIQTQHDMIKDQSTLIRSVGKAEGIMIIEARQNLEGNEFIGDWSFLQVSSESSEKQARKKQTEISSAVLTCLKNDM
jgi:predicted HicB family RNase H-like nuclease